MNMAAVTPQMSVQTAPAANAGSQAAGKAQGGSPNGFAGALVQAISGTGGTSQTSVQAPILAADVASLLAQAQAQQSDTASASDPLAMLGALLEQLQQKPSEDDAASGSGASDRMAELLASLQALLGLLDPADSLQLSSSLNANAGDASAVLPSSDGAGAGMLATLLPVLLQAMKQASQSPEQLNQLAQPIADLAQQMQQALAIADGTQQTAASQSSVSAQETLATATQAQPTGATVAQSAVVIASAEPRKAVSAFKEPIVYWHLAEDAAASDQTADVPVVTAAGDAQQASDQPASYGLMLAQNQVQTAADAGKAALPAQVPVQQFTQLVGNYLVKQFTLSGGNGIATAKLSLHPDHLGQVDVRIEMQDGQLTAQFVAHNGTAKELLENQMSLLRTALQTQGIQVEKMDVVQPSDLTGQASFLGQEQRDSGSGQGGGQASRRERDGSYEEPVDFEAEMERTSALREAGYGSSINVTA